MGIIQSFRKGLFGTCRFWLSDFPYETNKVTLPWLVFDNLGVLCEGGRPARIFNAVSHLGAAVGFVLAARTGFSEKLGSLLEPLLGANHKANAFALYYGGFNIAMILLKFIAAAGRPTDPDELPSAAKCTLNPLGCVASFFSWLGNNVKARIGRPLKCDALDESYDAGLCYPKKSEKIEREYKFVGPIGWPHCGPKDEYRDDGAFCWKKGSYDRGVGKVPTICADDKERWGGLCHKKCPTGSRRTASCTCDFGRYRGVYTKCGIGIHGRLKHGDECVDLNWDKVGKNRQIYKDRGSGWFKSATCTCQKGGVITNCSRYGEGTIAKTCPTTHPDKAAGLCYPTPKSGFKCAATSCSRICPLHTKDAGATCTKVSLSRGVGKPIHACSADEEKIGLLCYDRCETKYGPEFKRKGLLCVKVGEEQINEQIAHAVELRDQLVAAQASSPTDTRLAQNILRLNEKLAELQAS